jgi:hypothetical protein
VCVCVCVCVSTRTYTCRWLAVRSHLHCCCCDWELTVLEERVRASAGNLLWWVGRLVFILCSKVSRQNTPMQFFVRAELVSLLASENKMGNDKKTIH